MTEVSTKAGGVLVGPKQGVAEPELYDITDIDKLQEKVKEIQQGKLQLLFDESDAIQARINELAKLPNKIDAARQKAILEAEHTNVRAEIAKRSADVGTLTNAIFALLDKLGLQTQKAGDDSPADIAKRDSALQKITIAQESLAGAKTQESEARNAWWGKDKKIAAAMMVVRRAEESLRAAEDNVAVVEEQIGVDKRERIRNASLSENFALLRQLTERTVAIRQDDVDQSIERADSTERSLKSALEKRLESSQKLEEVRKSVQDLAKQLDTEERALSEIADQSSPLYAQQSIVVTEMQQKMTALKGEELILNSDVMSKTLVIEASRSTLGGLRVQIDTGKVHIIKLTHAEKNAQILGQNIDRMVKNVTGETASDSLDRTMDNLVFTSVELGIEAEVASADARNKAIERHGEMMQRVHEVRALGDEAMAKHAHQYLELDAQIRQGYKDRGIDIEMSNLAAAASTIAALNKAPQTPVGTKQDVTF